MFKGTDKINIKKTPKLALFAIQAANTATKLSKRVHDVPSYTAYIVHEGETMKDRKAFIMTANSKSITIGVPHAVAQTLTQYSFTEGSRPTDWPHLYITESYADNAETIICDIIKSLI